MKEKNPLQVLGVWEEVTGILEAVDLHQETITIDGQRIFLISETINSELICKLRISSHISMLRTDLKNRHYIVREIDGILWSNAWVNCK